MALHFTRIGIAVSGTRCHELMWAVQPASVLGMSCRGPERIESPIGPVVWGGPNPATYTVDMMWTFSLKAFARRSSMIFSPTSGPGRISSNRMKRCEYSRRRMCSSSCSTNICSRSGFQYPRSPSKTPVPNLNPTEATWTLPSSHGTTRSSR